MIKCKTPSASTLELHPQILRANTDSTRQQEIPAVAVYLRKLSKLYMIEELKHHDCVEYTIWPALCMHHRMNQNYICNSTLSLWHVNHGDTRRTCAAKAFLNGLLVTARIYLSPWWATTFHQAARALVCLTLHRWIQLLWICGCHVNSSAIVYLLVLERFNDWYSGSPLAKR